MNYRSSAQVKNILPNNATRSSEEGPHKRFAPTRKQTPDADAEVAGTAGRHEALAGEVAAAAIAVEGYGLRLFAMRVVDG